MPSPLDDLRRMRRQEICHQLKLPSRPRYLYLLLEPDRDVIRYVGVCSDPLARFSAHTAAIPPKKKMRVRKWIESLMERGELPRMLVVGKMGGLGWSCDQQICVTELLEAAERELIRRFTLGRWAGNTQMENDLLNVVGVPKT